jgi:hypothetical protein
VVTPAGSFKPRREGGEPGVASRSFCCHSGVPPSPTLAQADPPVLESQAACCLELRELQRDGCFCQRAFLGYLAQFEQLERSILTGASRMCDVQLSLSVDAALCASAVSPPRSTGARHF